MWPAGSGIHWSHARAIHGHGESAADQVEMDHPNLVARVNFRKLSEYSSGRTGFPNGFTIPAPSQLPTGQIHQMSARNLAHRKEKVAHWRPDVYHS